jgi:hypothetical protein
MDSDALWACNMRYDWAMRQFEKERLAKEAVEKDNKMLREALKVISLLPGLWDTHEIAVKALKETDHDHSS